MNNIIKYVRNRNSSDLKYNDLENDSRNYEEIAIDQVLQSNDIVDLNITSRVNNNNNNNNSLDIALNTDARPSMSNFHFNQYFTVI
jgi:hypothetical protein